MTESTLPPAPPQPPSPPAATARVPLPEGLRGWTTFVGVVTVIQGGLQVLTCIGIPQGVLVIVAGVMLLGANNTLLAVPSVEVSLEPFFTKLKSFMMFTGIFYIVSIIVGILVLVLYFGAIMAMLSHQGNW